MFANVYKVSLVKYFASTLLYSKEKKQGTYGHAGRHFRCDGITELLPNPHVPASNSCIQIIL